MVFFNKRIIFTFNLLIHLYLWDIFVNKLELERKIEKIQKSVVEERGNFKGIKKPEA